jgi:hypothetical protein
VTISNPKFNFDCLLQDAIDRKESDDHDANSTDEQDAIKDGQDGQSHPWEYHEILHTDAPSQPSPSSKDHRRARKKLQSHNHQSKQHQKIQQESFSHHECQSSAYRKYISTAMPIVTPMSTANAPVTKSALVGLDDRIRSRGQYQLEDMVGEGSTFQFEYQVWDGR